MIIFQNDKFRITEVLDHNYTYSDLKGDIYDPELNPDICPEELKEQELEFEKKVETEGVFGYELEKIVMGGWEHIDSCYGFVGDHETNDHYIVDEYKTQIQALQFRQFNFNSDRELLTLDDRKLIFELLAKGLRDKNRALLYRRLFDGFDNLIPYHGILGRLIKDRGVWSYCAGQSYPDEIRTVRKIILELK